MGHELDGDVTPIKTGLGFALKRSGDFIGKSALTEQISSGVKSQIATIILDDENAVPLGHEPVYHRSLLIGETTSAAFGYRIGKPITLANITVEIENKQKIGLEIAGELYTGSIFFGPAFDPLGQRMRDLKP